MKDLRKLENLHVGFWLLKDTSWCQHWVAAGLIAAVPTLALSIVIAWKSRHTLGEFVHSTAVCLWIMANIIWMVGEFFYDDGTRAWARVPFFSGMIIVTLYYSAIGLRLIKADQIVAV